MTFHFRQVKVRSGAAANQLFGIMEKEKPKIKKGGGNRLTVNFEMFFQQVPAARSDDQRGNSGSQLIDFSFGICKLNGFSNGIE